MVLAILIASPAYATFIVIPYTFVPNTLIVSSQVNANFSVISSVVNGNLDNSNLSAGANISLSKLNNTQTFLDLQASGSSLGLGVGMTGDAQPRVGMYGDGSLRFGIGGSTPPDVEFIHSAINTVQLNNTASGPANLDMNGGKILNVGSLPTPDVQGLRVSISSTLPVPADGTSTTVYAVPYTSGYIGLYNASNLWVTDVVTSISVALPATTNTNYDVYVFDSTGTATLGLAAWSGATPPSRGNQNGVPYTNGSVYDRWIGCVATNGTSGTTEDDTSERLVWNYNNKLPRPLFATFSASAYTYSSSTVRASDSNSTYGQGRVGMLNGLINSNPVDITFTATTNTTSNSANNAIGLDSTTVVSSGVGGQLGAGGTSSTNVIRYCPSNLTAGFHYFQMLEFTTSSAQGGWLAGAAGSPGQFLQGVTIQ